MNQPLFSRANIVDGRRRLLRVPGKVVLPARRCPTLRIESMGSRRKGHVPREQETLGLVSVLITKATKKLQPAIAPWQGNSAELKMKKPLSLGSESASAKFPQNGLAFG